MSYEQLLKNDKYQVSKNFFISLFVDVFFYIKLLEKLNLDRFVFSRNQQFYYLKWVLP